MKRIRTLWLSDVHLGSRSCQADKLLTFLGAIECDQLYLIGDIVDIIALRRSVYWPDSHTQVVHKLLDFARCGTEVAYIPGNHDDPFRSFAAGSFYGVQIEQRLIHRTRQGKRLLVVHGDEMDIGIRCGNWLRHAGSFGYRALMKLHRNVNRLRAQFGMPYWSLAAQIKQRVGRAMEFTAAFENGMVELARRAGVDGVVCGHIHHAAMKDIDGLLYCNDGDWVETCSALAENLDGRLEIIRWSDMEQQTATGITLQVPRRAA